MPEGPNESSVLLVMCAFIILQVRASVFRSKYLTQLTDKMHELTNKSDMMITSFKIIISINICIDLLSVDTVCTLVQNSE